MNVLLAGGRQNQLYLLKSLQEKGHRVTIIHADDAWCHMLADTYEIPAVCSSPCDVTALREAKAERAEAVIALEERDADNLIICELAKKQFHIKHTLALINDPKNAAMFYSLGVDRCVNTADIFTGIIEQESIEGNIRQYLPIADDRVIVCEVQITEKSPALGKKLWELGFPPQSIVASILRKDEILLPQGSTILLAGDRAVVLSSAHSMKETLIILNGKK